MQATDVSARNELTLRGSASRIAELLKRLKQFTANGWSRDTAAEARLRGLPSRKMYCFVCAASGSKPAAAVWLQQRGPEEVGVANVVPLQKRELSTEEHNSVLEAFQSDVIEPAQQGLHLDRNLEPHRVAPDQYLSSEAVRRLRAFSTSANRACLDSNDWRRWQEFVVQAHLDGAGFDSPLLMCWLAEEGWPEERQRELAAIWLSSA